MVAFVNGVHKVYDGQRLLNLERFQLLKNDAFFQAVTVDPGGYGVVWDDEMDVSEYELWNNGVEVEQSLISIEFTAQSPASAEAQGAS